MSFMASDFDITGHFFIEDGRQASDTGSLKETVIVIRLLKGVFKSVFLCAFRRKIAEHISFIEDFM